MDGEMGHIAVRDVLESPNGDGPVSAQVTQQAQRIVDAQLNNAMELLTEDRPALDKLVEALLQTSRLTREEMEALLHGAS